MTLWDDKQSVFRLKWNHIYRVQCHTDKPSKLFDHHCSHSGKGTFHFRGTEFLYYFEALVKCCGWVMTFCWWAMVLCCTIYAVLTNAPQVLRILTLFQEMSQSHWYYKLNQCFTVYSLLTSQKWLQVVRACLHIMHDRYRQTNIQIYR